MNKMLAVIFSDEFSTSEVLKMYSSEIENLEVCVLSSNQQVYEKISSIEDKSVLVVDLSQNTQEKTDLIKQVSAQCPNCSVIALSDSVSVELIVEAMRSGAKEFLPVPVIKTEYLSALKKVISQSELPKSKNNCKIISVFSNKGGLGKTSLATNLALKM